MGCNPGDLGSGWPRMADVLDHGSGSGRASSVHLRVAWAAFPRVRFVDDAWEAQADIELAQLQGKALAGVLVDDYK